MSPFRIENLIIGESKAIRQLRERVIKLAPSRVLVLITNLGNVFSKATKEFLDYLHDVLPQK